MRLAAQPDAAGRRDLLLRRRRRRRSGRNSSGNATIAADVLPEFLREYSSAAPSLHVLRHEASRVGNGINTSSDGDVKKILYLDDEMIYPPLLVESLSRAADRRPDSAVAFSGARAARSLPPDQAHRPRSSTCTPTCTSTWARATGSYRPIWKASGWTVLVMPPDGSLEVRVGPSNALSSQGMHENATFAAAYLKDRLGI